MSGDGKKKRWWVKLLKVVGWVFLSVILLLITVALLIQLPPIQNRITQKAISFLEKKIGTDVNLEHISIGFPKSIVVEGLYFEDQSKDTLLYIGELSVDTDLWGLTKKEIALDELTLTDTKAYIDRAENDSAYNFSYILKAFAGDSTAADTTTQPGWTFSIGDIALENIQAKYHDHLTGNLADLYLGALEVSISEFNLDSLKIIVDEISLSGTRANVVQTKQPEVTEEVAEEKQPITYDVGVASVTLNDIEINFHQKATGQIIRLDLDESELKTDKIDLKEQRINLASFKLHNTFFSYQQAAAQVTSPKSQKDPEPPAEKAAEEAKVWVIALGETDLSGNSIQYYDLRKPFDKRAMDFDHLWLNNLNLRARNLVMAGSAIKADVENLSFRDRSGFEIKQFTTKIDLKESSLAISNLRLLTNNSRFEINANASYPSLATISNNIAKTYVAANINQTTIGIRDLLYFNPALKDSLPVQLTSDSKIKIDASLKGYLSNLNIGHLTVQGLSHTQLAMSGTIKGLPDARNLSMDVHLKKFYTTNSDIRRILPDTALATIKLPEWINVSGTYKGNLRQSEFLTAIRSSVGTIDASGKINVDSTSASRGYDAQVRVANLDLGYILDKPDTIGKLNMTASVTAAGLVPDEMNGKFSAIVQSFDYQKYQYNNLRIDGTILNSLYTGNATMKDQHLEFAAVAEVNYRDDIPKYNITFDLKNADFKALNLSQRDLKARGVFVANLSSPDFQVINGNFGLRKVAIHNGDDLYAVDSLLFASLDQTGRSELTIDSDLLSGKFEGSFNIFKLPTALREYVNTYYNLHDSSIVNKPDPGRQYFNFELNLKKTELLTDILVPELTDFKPKEFKGQFDSEAKTLNIDLVVDAIQYNTIGVKALKFSTRSDTQQLTYKLTADKILLDSTRIDGIDLSGSIANNEINTNLIVLDSADQDKYVLGGIFKSLENSFQFSFRPDGVKLNYVDWTVTPDNYLRFGGAKILANNVQLQNGREKIIIDSKDDPASTLFIGFRELNLEYLVSMINREKPVSGLLQGDIYIIPDTANMSFTADVGIKDFSISEIPWGDIHFAVDRKTQNQYNVGLSIDSKENRVTAQGSYQGGATPTIDLIAAIERFNLKTIEPLTTAQIKDLQGNVTGRMVIKGPTKKPSIRGAINLADVAFFSNYVMSAFSINRETIAFDEQGIAFNTFEILDKKKNKAIVDGRIKTTDYSDFNFDLNVTAERFRLLNTGEKDNELFYGLVDVNARAHVGGTLVQPIVDATLSLGEDSKLTYVVPQNTPGVMDHEGIVRFVDRTFQNDKFMKQAVKQDTTKAQFKGIDLTARIDLSDQEQFTVVIDPTTGDQLTVRGNTTLTLEMDPTGDMNLSGRYEISEGTYNLSFYKFVKREFRIEKGSTMTWAGNPMNATMDLTAIYDVETAPVDLLANQLEPNNVAQYKQRLPFWVYLNIDGQLLSPEISFKLDMPESERNYGGGIVYSKLQDINTRESDLNKQVFALLILKRFISDNPFENQGAQGFEGTARTSVSKMLTEQLNRLSENVRGVELSFDVKSYEDYSSGEAEGQTELQLGLSKTLFNDRLVVKVAGNVGVEGQSNQQATDYIGDLALEYKLTEDGRFRIIGFRNSDYDMIDGQLTETGTGLIFIKDYDLLSELFKANEKNSRKK